MQPPRRTLWQSSLACPNTSWAVRKQSWSLSPFTVSGRQLYYTICPFYLQICNGLSVVEWYLFNALTLGGYLLRLCSTFRWVSDRCSVQRKWKRSSTTGLEGMMIYINSLCRQIYSRAHTSTHTFRCTQKGQRKQVFMEVGLIYFYKY